MKRFMPITLVVLISFISLFPLFHSGMFSSHDGDLQIARIGAYYKAIKDGQVLVRWGADLNSGYGHPVLIFMYPFPSYLGALLYSFGIPLVIVFKIITGGSFILANVCMYLFLKHFFKDDSAALVGAFFYSFAPYRFLDMYVRGDIGEELSFIFIPLILFSIVSISKKKNVLQVVLGGIFFALLVLSHNGFTLIFTPILIGFLILTIIFKRSNIILFQGVIMILIGLLLSMFFWLPALYESRFTQAKTLIGSMYQKEFPPITSLFYSPWGFGSEVGKPGGLSPQIGIVHLIVIMVSLVVLLQVFLRKKNLFTLQSFTSMLSSFFILVSIVAIFFMTPFSVFLWSKAPLLPYLQFPWRLTSVTVLSSAFLASFLLSKEVNIGHRKSVAILASFLVILFSVSYWKVSSYYFLNEKTYINFEGDTTWHGQANSIWTDTNKLTPAKERVEIIDGDAAIQSIDRTSTKHSFIINVKKNAKILDNTIYFPGWQVLVDGEKTNIEFQDINHRGLITFNVPQGLHSIDVVFKESPIRLFSDIVSVITLFMLAIVNLAYRTIKQR